MGTVDLQLNPAALQAQLDTQLVRLSTHARLTMRGISMVPTGTELGGQQDEGVRYTIGDPVVVSDAVKSSATAWAVGSALSDAVNALALLCEESWRMCLVAQAAQSGPLKVPPSDKPVRLDIGNLADRLVGEKEARRIDKLGLSDKLRSLNEKFGIALSWEEELDSLRRARNCFTHRFGVVGSDDADAGGVLTLRFRVLQLFVKTPDGEELPLNPPMFLEKGGEVSVKFGAEKQKVVPVGKPIVLSEIELEDLLMTVKPAGDSLIRATAGFVQTCIGSHKPTDKSQSDSEDPGTGS